MIVSVVSLYDTYLGGLFVSLTSPLLFNSVVEPLLWRSRRSFGNQDGDYQGTIRIYRFIYSHVICVHVKPA